MVEVPTILVLGLIVTIVVLLYWKDAINSKLTIADARANEHKTQADANVRLLGQAMSKLSKPALNSDNEISKLKGLVDDLRHSAVDLDKTYQQDLYRKQQHIVRLTNELSVYKNASSKPGLRTPKNLESETERLRAKVEKSQSLSDLPNIDNQQDKNPNPKYVQSTQPKLTKEQMWAKRHADDKKRHKEQKRQQELLWLEAERVKESNKEQKLLLKETRLKKTRLPCWHCKKVTTNPDDCEHCGADSSVNGYFGFTANPQRDYSQREADAFEGMAAHAYYLETQGSESESEYPDYDDHDIERGDS